MQRFQFQETPLSGVYEIQCSRLSDSRGSFSRLFCDASFRQIGFDKNVVQINSSFTKQQGSIRGLHFQRSLFAETKIVTCLKGEVFDVAVDIRTHSPTFLQWFGIYLSCENKKSLLIPEGFAHGFQTLSDDVDMLYFVTAPYAPDYEGGLNYAEPKVAIEWPLGITEISDKDRHWPFLHNDFKGLDLTVDR